MEEYREALTPRQKEFVRQAVVSGELTALTHTAASFGGMISEEALENFRYIKRLSDFTYEPGESKNAKKARAALGGGLPK